MGFVNMKCTKCGNELNSNKCDKCHFENGCCEMNYLWELSSEQLNDIMFKYLRTKPQGEREKEKLFIKTNNITVEENIKKEDNDKKDYLKNIFEDKKNKAESSSENITEKSNKNNARKKVLVYSILTVAVFLLFYFCFFNQNNKEWSEWVDYLPRNITNKRYEIKERTLYSSRIKEITIEKSDVKEGWELYDVVDNGVVHGEWSDWSTQESIASDVKDVQEELRYRSREKEYIKSDTQTLEGWKLDKVTYEENDNMTWSDWSLDKPKLEQNKYEIQEKVQYSFRNKIFTSSGNETLDGWTRYDEGKEYGEWSDWGNNRIESSETIEVNTRKVKTGTEYQMAHYCTGNVPGAQYLTARRNKTTNEVFNNSCMFHSLGFFTSLEQFFSIGDGEYLYKGTNTNDCYRCSNTCYRWYIVEQKDVFITQYSFREVKPIYYYYQWSEWSEYSDNKKTDDNCEIRERTLYRYRDISKKPIYILWKWGEWSDWTAEEILESSNCEIEKHKFYRHRDIIEDVDYYFKRYSDWSEFSENVINDTDTIEVKTKIQYSYKKK